MPGHTLRPLSSKPFCPCMFSKLVLLQKSAWGLILRKRKTSLSLLLISSCSSFWWLSGKESACQPEDLGSIPGSGRSTGEWKGYPLQYSGLENSTDCVAHGVAESQTRLSDFHSYSHATQVPVFSRCLTYGKAESSLPARDLELETIPLHFNFPLSIEESRYLFV